MAEEKMMDFGEAIRAMKEGYRVTRQGWNGKGMWVALSAPGPRVMPAEAMWSLHARDFAMSEGQGYHATVLPSFVMKTAGNEIVNGWLASQSDMLAEDWDYA